MEVDNSQYKNEFENQLSELEEEIALLTLAHAYVAQHLLARFFKKALLIFIELCFYGIFVTTIAALISMSFLAHPLSLEIPFNETAALVFRIDINAVNVFILIFKVLALLFAIWNLMLGLLFRKLRSKNNKLQDVTEMFKSLIDANTTRLARIKMLGLAP